MRDGKDDIWNPILQEYPGLTAMVENPKPRSLEAEMKTPKEIVEELDRTVIGQDEAKQLIAIAAWNRLLAMNNKLLGRNEEEFYFEKNNILLIGGTGCGKTHTIRSLSKAVGLPVVIEDATTFTNSGYVGRDVESALEGLVDRAYDMVCENYDLTGMLPSRVSEMVKELAEFGIVYIDEADKVRATQGRGKDVNGRGVQESFLKLVEGSQTRVKSPGYSGKIDTSNMLFIFGGAFAGMQDIIQRRVSVKGGIGFHAAEKKEVSKEDIFQHANIGDFTEFGIIPELMGRLSTVAVLKDLNKNTIKRIFCEPQRSIMSQAINEFKSYGVYASFTDDAISYIVDKTMELNLGARGLKSTVQKMLRPLFFYLPSNAVNADVVISKEMLVKINKKGLA